ncbi:hypothetical protein K6119_15255 [Paracrocinitomix mangrovi]|uniref:hypothetical protein n=1 Tax=Paracrocinitomix mangrovi TaxID=2862509 RepID=UPI001C8E9303|nr:hypothetical protein [Paracrocinitomix mangrovi]UKN01087.1 hypothetical protein K6119_15255 [Paracrocinitomix mangrovi]
MFSTRFIIYLIVLFVTLVWGLVHFKKLSNSYKLLVLLVGYTFISETLSRFYYLFAATTFPLYHIIAVVSIILNAMIYTKLSYNNKKSNSIIIGISAVFLTLCILNSVLVQPINTFPSHSLMLHGLQSISLALFSYLQMLKHPSEVSLTKQPMFWLNTGNFVFYGLTFTIFSVFNVFYPTATMASWVYWLIWMGNIFLYSCYFLAIHLNLSTKNE